MRLRAIYEGMARSDFFDFYALLDAYYNNPNDAEITRRLTFIADRVYHEHMNQLADVIINRLPDMEHAESMDLMRTKYGVGLEGFKHTNLDKLNLQQKAALLKDILVFDRSHGFTGNTWKQLGRTFIALSNTPNHLKSKIMALDKLYNLFHHNGMITDYMDDSDWLEDSLNARDSATPAQLFALASPETRTLIGRSAYTGQFNGKVSDIQKLHTAIRKRIQNKDGLSVDMNGNIITLHGEFTPLLWTTGEPAIIGQASPFVSWGQKVSERTAQFLKTGQFELGTPISATLTITDNKDQLEIHAENQKINIPKPINVWTQLVDDIIRGLQGFATYGELKQNKFIMGGKSRFKNKYYRLKSDFINPPKAPLAASSPT